MTTILMVGYAKDIQTTTQIKVLKALGADVRLLCPFSGSAERPIVWSDDDASFGAYRVDDVDAVIVRASAPLVPSASVFAAANDGRLDYRTWFQSSCLQRDRHDAALGLLLSLGARGIPLFNDPRGSHFSRRKPFQIQTMRVLGIDHPKTLLTNDDRAARDFVASHPHTIVKPAAGGALTLRGEDLSDEDYKFLRQAPALFQERIFGRDLRVMVLDDKVISTAAVNVPKDTLDFRGDKTYQQGHITYDDVALPEAVQTQAIEFTKAVGLRFAGIDIKHTPEGRFAILEVNSSPIYLDVERKLQHPITRIFIEHVIAESLRK